jgi:hypothetical protein
VGLIGHHDTVASHRMASHTYTNMDFIEDWGLLEQHDYLILASHTHTRCTLVDIIGICIALYTREVKGCPRKQHSCEQHIQRSGSVLQ